MFCVLGCSMLLLVPPPAEAAPDPQTGPVRRDQRQPAPSNPDDVNRPSERVPIRSRRDSIGRAAYFRLEPTIGPVGTVVLIYGDFRNPGQGNRRYRKSDIDYFFPGMRRPKAPIRVSRNRIAVVVPPRAKSGEVRVRIRGHVAFRGYFAVIPKDGGIFVPTPEGKGLLGAVYRIPPKSRRLPDFDRLGAPFATITLPTLAVGARRFEQGFPGLGAVSSQTLLEWFAIRFVGRIDIRRPGSYQFRLNSDDGAKLYIDDTLVIDNDGQHAPRAKDGTISLSRGKHHIVVEYYQGPRFQIALELMWRRPGQRQFRIVPAAAFSRYLDDDVSPPISTPAPDQPDCDEPPRVACCKALTAECRACQRRAQAERRRWERACARQK